MPESLSRLGAQIVAPHKIQFRYRPTTAGGGGDAGVGDAGAILAAAAASGLVIRDVSTEEADLEDIFLQVVHGADAQA
jgi:ABC-2 type transport system ATP-binding protein